MKILIAAILTALLSFSHYKETIAIDLSQLTGKGRKASVIRDREPQKIKTHVPWSIKNSLVSLQYECTHWCSGFFINSLYILTVRKCAEDLSNKGLGWASALFSVNDNVLTERRFIKEVHDIINCSDLQLISLKVQDKDSKPSSVTPLIRQDLEDCSDAVALSLDEHLNFVDAYIPEIKIEDNIKVKIDSGMRTDYEQLGTLLFNSRGPIGLCNGFNKEETFTFIKITDKVDCIDDTINYIEGSPIHQPNN